jgi:hypothetical protein
VTFWAFAADHPGAATLMVLIMAMGAESVAAQLVKAVRNGR